MASDVNKHLERAKKFLEKNRVEDAIEAYLAVLNEAPQHAEAAQALGDLYARVDQPDRAAVYYGHLFDLLVEPKDETKALAIYNRFLRHSQVAQSPERIARYAFLQQKQNRPEEAIEQYSKAAELFSEAGAGRGRVVLLGAHRAARSRQFETPVEGGGGRGAIGNEHPGSAVVSALWTTGCCRWRPERGVELPGARVWTGAAGAQRGTALRRREIAEWRVGGGCGVARTLRCERK